jgi:hypothetical protein
MEGSARSTSRRPRPGHHTDPFCSMPQSMACGQHARTHGLPSMRGFLRHQRRHNPSRRHALTPLPTGKQPPSAPPRWYVRWAPCDAMPSPPPRTHCTPHIVLGAAHLAPDARRPRRCSPCPRCLRHPRILSDAHPTLDARFGCVRYPDARILAPPTPSVAEKVLASLGGERTTMSPVLTPTARSHETTGGGEGFGVPRWREDDEACPAPCCSP